MNIKELSKIESPKWCSEALDNMRRHFAGTVRKNLSTLSQGWTGRPTFSSESIALLFGDISQHSHVFHVSDILWGFNLTEPQVTKGWAYFLSTSSSISKGMTSRSHLFLESLFEITQTEGECSNVWAGVPSIHVIAEQGLVGSNKRYVDLLFQENSYTGDALVTAIEFKIGHVATEGQLDDMRKRISNKNSKINGMKVNAAHLFFVAPNVEGLQGKEARSKGWKPVPWFSLMRKFDRKLMDNPGFDDPDFQRFRRSVWALTTGV